MLGSAEYAEADRLVILFTEELGLVRAVAKSVRSVGSKLKFSLQDFTYARMDLVRGKEVWRVTDAQEIARISSNTPDGGPEKIKILAGIFSLLKRFVHGEERDDELFRTLRDVFFFLLREKLSEEELKNMETYSALKILTLLGYAEDGKFAEALFTKALLAQFAPHRRDAVAKINTAMKESQL